MEAPKIRQIHPMFVPFASALFPAAFAAFCVYCATGIREFEAGAFVCAMFGMAGHARDGGDGTSRLVDALQGVHDERLPDQDRGGVRPDAAGGSAVLLRAFHPDLAVLPLGGLGWVYFGLLAACSATCVVLGYYGGKLVFH